MINVAFSRVADRMLIADPGLLRLRNALRSVISCSVTGFIAVSWAFSHHHPITIAALAVLSAMIAPLFVREANRSSWFVSLLTIYGFAVLSYVSAAVLARYPIAGDIGFLAVFFTGILCQACGPRALGSALVSIVTFYLGLYLHPTPGELGLALPLSLLAPVMITIAGRLLLPARPARTLRRAIATVTLRASRLLKRYPSGSAVELDTLWSSLNEAALALEDHLSLLTPPDAFAARERIVELEIAAGQCRFRDDRVHASDTAAQMLGQAIERLSAMGRRRRGESPQADARSGATAPLSVTFSRTTASPSNNSFPFTLGSLRRGMAESPLAARFADFRARLSWLHATRATTAAVIAMLIGHSLSPERWFWAVISVFVVFLGTRSRADTIHRGLERMGGTIAGALVSALLAIWLHDTLSGMIAAMVLCAFGWAYFILSSYSRGVFFITIIVGLIYAQLGFAIGPLVELRIEEVLIGCLVSFAVAFLVMPLSATRHIDTRLLAMLCALRDAVHAAARPTATDTAGRPAAPSAPVLAMRRLDRSWHDLRIALRPFQTQRVFVWNPGYERVTGSLLTCLHWTRMVIQRTEAARASSATLTAPQRGASSLSGAYGSLGAHNDAAASARDDLDALRAQRLSSILSRLDGLIAHYQQAATVGIKHANRANDTRHLSTSMTSTLSAALRLPADADVSPMLMQLDGAVVQLVERLHLSATAKPRMRWAVRAE